MAVQRLVYLVTYSQADLEKFPNRAEFAQIIANGFESKGVSVVQWIVSLEAHQVEGYHYHVAVKLSRRMRFANVRKAIYDQHTINVNFSEGEEGDTYYSAFLYVRKHDDEYVTSPNHPEMTALPQVTDRATASRCKKGRSNTKDGKRKRDRMSDFDLLTIVQEKKFKSRIEVMSLASRLQLQGNSSLARFIANRGSKCVDNALSLAKELAESTETLLRQCKSRLDILRAELLQDCVTGCEKSWLNCAVEVVSQNGIDVPAFAKAIFDLLQLGRGKFRNVYIHGPANCGKSFILQPLKLIYKCFLNPAHGTFAWVGVDESELVFLNDFRWNPTLISWETFLVLLEGDVTHLPAPKNFCHRDIEVKNDVPIVATADMPIVFVKGGTIDQVNTRMMEVRWRSFHFWKVISESQRKEIAPCGRCFAEFVFEFGRQNEPS